MFFLKRECLTIIGTAHVSEESVNEVKDAIYEQHPEVVAIELDIGRYTRLKNQMNGIEEDDSISVTKIIKENKVGLFFTSTLLSYFQSKIGADLDVAPGSEMIGAIEASEDLGIPIALIDRDVNITLQRALNKMGFIEKAKFMFGLIASALGHGDEEDIDVEEFIAVKGYKAKGKRVTTSKVKEFRWLEPRPEPEPEPEEEQPETDLNTVDEEREGFAEGTQTSLF